MKVTYVKITRVIRYICVEMTYMVEINILAPRKNYKSNLTFEKII